MPPNEGFQSEQLTAALRDALAGRPAELERLLARMGAVVTAKPNLRLAAAFGAEVATAPAGAKLLQRLGAEDAAPDTDRAFFPIAAAHGWAARARAGRDVEAAWAALGELAGDERAPVRVGTRDALATLTAREGGPDDLVTHGQEWLTIENRDVRFGAAEIVASLLGERKLVAAVRDPEALLAYLGAVVTEIAEAPRSAERSDGRGRLLSTLPRALAAAVIQRITGAEDWLDAICAEATHVAVRAVLSDTVIRLRSDGPSASTAERLAATLGMSAKPLRDPTRLRPGSGRGKATRRLR